MSFGQGLSGLKAAAQRLDVIGNNIANSGTVGFKSSTVSFADVYASSRVGLGTQVAAVNPNFTVGNLTVTGGQFDLAIDGSKGLFRIEDASGAVYFTRNGEFAPNKDGYLVNAQGYFLTGYIRNPADGSYSLSPRPIQLPMGNIAPRATGAEDGVRARAMNLDAGTEAIDPATTPFSVTEPNSFHMSVPLTVYDSLGREHQLTQYFVKRDTNEWEVYYQLGTELLVDGSSNPVSHTLKFQDNGEIETSATIISKDLEFASTVFTKLAGAADLEFTVDYSTATQFGGNFNYEFVQDGYPTGEYASMAVAADGTVVANYTNGEMLEVGYVVLADFTNMLGLSPVGGNAWSQTPESGAPRLGRPGINGLATIMSQALEESNVDISTELVNMIITQRTYQANAQSISTQSEMMQALMNIR